MTAVENPTTARRSSTAATSVPSRWTLPFEGRWLLTGFAFPPAGYLASLLGPVDGPVGAIVGGVSAGAVIGAGQWLALRSAGGRPGLLGRWLVATVAGMVVGLTAGSAAVGYRTSTADLVVMGLITGAALGPAQAIALRTSGLTSRLGALAWAATVPAIWAAGWFVTSEAGIDVERQYAVFGALGALTCSALGGLVLGRLTRRARANARR